MQPPVRRRSSQVRLQKRPLQPRGARERERDPRFLFIREPGHVREATGLGQRAHGLGPGLEIRCDPALVAGDRRRGADPHRDVRDHTERPLGPDDQLAERGAGGRVRGLQRGESPGRAQQLDRGNQLVEAPVSGRRLTGRAGCREPADGRVFERLRKVAERQALGAERGLRLGAAEPRPEPGGQRRVVHVAVPQAAGDRARSRRRAGPGPDRPRPRRWCRHRTERPRRRSRPRPRAPPPPARRTAPRPPRRARHRAVRCAP